MKICFISDTHEMHDQIEPAIIAAEADVLIHCGDFTGRGNLEKIGDFADWCEKLLSKEHVKHVIAIAGNHDLSLDASLPNAGSKPEVAQIRLRAAGVRYLEQGGTEIDGVVFWGSPWTPRFYDWGFQIDDDAHDERLWAEVPLCDVLITHGPPHGIRDRSQRGHPCGSAALRRAVERVRPRIHAFGHIHGGHGITVAQHTVFVNAATCTEEYRPKNLPIVLEIAVTSSDPVPR